MRSLILRLLLLFLIAVLPAVAVNVMVPPTSVVADDDKDESGQNEHDDDDHDDDDGPGNSNPPGKAKGHDKNTDTSTSNNRDNNGKSIETLEHYRVDVTCDYDADAGQTTCDFTGIAPEDGKKVGFVQVPSAAVCAEVLETEAEFVDPDPNTHVTGYKSRGNDGAVSLVLDGEVVTTEATTTYWIKAAENIIPASGPGITCPVPAAAETATDTASEGGKTMVISTPTPTPAPTSGTLAVLSYACTDVPQDRTGYDWFGACEPNPTPHLFMIMPPGSAEAQANAETDEGGVATFTEVEPGMWELDLADRTWCHAKSDKVTAEGHVVIEAGQTTSVWIFLCEPQGQ